jgi:RimJ/RimL family protein N-acetyltransferase
VPVGPWILQDELLIGEIAAWRQRFRNFFLDQSESTELKTFDYFKKTSIPRDDRIFFIIYLEELAIGHIALSNVSSTSAELDNLMRGRTGGPSTLMTMVEQTVLNWAFKTLELNAVTLRILSKNPFALSIHEELGFKETRRCSLRMIESENSRVLQECEFALRSTSIELIEMKLEAKEFKGLRETLI